MVGPSESVPSYRERAGYPTVPGRALAAPPCDPPRPCGWDVRGRCVACNLVALKRAGVVRMARWSGPDMYRLPDGSWAEYHEVIAWMYGEGP
jgi:hypothetical protein